MIVLSGYTETHSNNYYRMCFWTISELFACGHSIRENALLGEEVRRVRPCLCVMAEELGIPCEQTGAALQVRVPVNCWDCWARSMIPVVDAAEALLHFSGLWLDASQEPVFQLDDIGISLENSMFLVHHAGISYEHTVDIMKRRIQMFEELRDQVLLEWNGHMPYNFESEDGDSHNGDDSESDDQAFEVESYTGSTAGDNDLGDYRPPPMTYEAFGPSGSLPISAHLATASTSYGEVTQTVVPRETSSSASEFESMDSSETAASTSSSPISSWQSHSPPVTQGSRLPRFHENLEDPIQRQDPRIRTRLHPVHLMKTFEQGALPQCQVQQPSTPLSQKLLNIFRREKNK